MCSSLRAASVSSCPCPGRAMRASGTISSGAPRLPSCATSTASFQPERWRPLSSRPMNFFAVLLALLCEQLKPLRHGNSIHQGVIAWVRWTGRNFDAGDEHHATVVWSITALGPALLTTAIYLAVHHYSVILALALD